MVTFLHQHQRERRETEGGSPYILATLAADYRWPSSWPRACWRVSLHELSRDAQELWEAVRAYTTQNGEAEPLEVAFSRLELREFTGWQDHWVRVALSELVEME